MKEVACHLVSLRAALVVDRSVQSLALYVTGGLHHETSLYNFDPLQPHFYIVKLGFTGVYIIFLVSAQKYRLWVLVRTASARRF